jgi:hypothetical protein
MSGLDGTVYEIVQYLSLLVAALVFYYELEHIYSEYKIHRRIITKAFIFGIPTIILMLNGIVFYTLLLSCKLTDCETFKSLFFTKWSTLLRLHGYTTFLMLALGRNFLSKKWIKK